MAESSTIPESVSAGDAPTAVATRSRKRLATALMMAPGGAWTVAFFLVPFGLLAVYSLGSINIVTYQVAFGWTVENYTRLADPLYLEALGRSLALTVGSVVGCALLGFPVAYTISRTSGRVRQLLLLAVIVPFWTSFIVRTYAWVSLLGTDGPIVSTLDALGLVAQETDLRYSWTAVGIAMVYSYLPLMILPIYVALERTDPSLIAAASDLGLPPRRVFRKVVLPLAMPGVVAGALLVGIPATGEYTIPAIMGGEKTLMVGNLVGNQFNKVGDYPFGSALAVALTAVLLLVLLTARSRVRRMEDVL